MGKVAGSEKLRHSNGKKTTINNKSKIFIVCFWNIMWWLWHLKCLPLCPKINLNFCHFVLCLLVFIINAKNDAVFINKNAFIFWDIFNRLVEKYDNKERFLNVFHNPCWLCLIQRSRVDPSRQFSIFLQQFFFLFFQQTNSSHFYKMFSLAKTYFNFCLFFPRYIFICPKKNQEEN